MIQVILFERPDPTQMQFMSLTPIPLVMHDKWKMTRLVSPFDPMEGKDEEDSVRVKGLIEKLRLHTVVANPPTEEELLLPTILSQANCSFELQALLQKNAGIIGPREKRTLSVSEQIIESATNSWEYIIRNLWSILTTWAFPMLTRLFLLGLMVLRIGAEILLRVINWNLGSEHAALKDVSATAQQLDIRLQQFCYWPMQYMALRKSKDDWASVTDGHPEYIRFFNSLWLVANDVIIGIALGSFIIENSDIVASQIDNFLSQWSLEALQRTIKWLTDWPAGLKLNTELASFLGDLSLWVIDYWSGMSRAQASYH